jgi:hypothetical protein
MKKAITVMSFILIGIYAKAEYCVLRYQQPPEPKVITKTKVVEKVVEKPVFVPVYKVEVVEKKVRKNNRISLLFGVAPSKLEETSSEVTMELGSVFGLQYQRMVQDDLSVGLQLQNNKTVLGTVGIDF